MNNPKKLNIYYPNIRSDILYLFNNIENKWDPEDIKRVIEDIIIYNTDRIDDFISSNQNNISSRTYNKLNDISDEREDNHKLHTKSIKMILLSFRDKVKLNYEAGTNRILNLDQSPVQ